VFFRWRCRRLRFLISAGEARRITVTPRRAGMIDAPALPRPTPGRHRNEQYVYLHAELARIIAATPTAITPTFLMTAYGKPFTAAGFGGWFRERCDEAGLPKECAAHGLRKAACRRLADAGCKRANVIAAISGHTSLREVERYTRAADQERMARIGMAALIKGRDVG
jgi:integrase